MKEHNAEKLLTENGLRLIAIVDDLVFADSFTEPGSGAMFVHDEGDEDDLFPVTDHYHSSAAFKQLEFRNQPFTTKTCKNIAAAIKQENEILERRFAESNNNISRAQAKSQFVLRGSITQTRQMAERIEEFCRTAVCPMNSTTGCQGRMVPSDEPDDLTYLSGVRASGEVICDKCGTKLIPDV